MKFTLLWLRIGRTGQKNHMKLEIVLKKKTKEYNKHLVHARLIANLKYIPIDMPTWTIAFLTYFLGLLLLNKLLGPNPTFEMAQILALK